MSTAVRGEELRQGSWPHMTAAEEDWQAWPDEQVLTLAHVTRVIAVVEAAGRVESELAETLRAMAAQSRGPAAARRLRLAEDAARGAQVATETSGRLRQQARRWAEDALVAGVHHLAANGQPESTPVVGTVRSPTCPESSTSVRLADIDRRLAELRQARLAMPGDGRASPKAGRDAERRALQARQRWQDAVANLRRARQLTAAAFRRAASAHDRAAEASARSASAGTGDVTEYNRRAAYHRAAANADRERAQDVPDQDESAGASTRALSR